MRGLIVGFVALLAGCVTPSLNYQPEVVNLSDPPIGQQSVAYVGDHMLRQGREARSDGIRLEKPARWPMVAKLSPGLFVKVGGDEKRTFYAPASGTWADRVDGSTFQYLVVRNGDRKRLCMIDVLGSESCTRHSNWAPTTVSAISENDFQRTLIYSGKVGDKINVAYREFSSDVARPAFNNDVEYDLSQSTTIGYKGSKIQVIEATNESITYVVLQNFAPAR